MNRTASALLALALLSTSLRAQAGDDLYLRPIGPAAAPPRYELLPSRPAVWTPNIVRTDIASVEGWDEAFRAVNAGGSFYLVRTSLPGAPERYQVKALPPGVSYLQSLGADSPALPEPSKIPGRPFGWPPSQNPLDRGPYR